MQFFAGELKSEIGKWQNTVQLLSTTCGFLLACRLSMAYCNVQRCACATRLRLVFVFICIVHIFCTQSMAFYHAIYMQISYM